MIGGRSTSSVAPQSGVLPGVAWLCVAAERHDRTTFNEAETSATSCTSSDEKPRRMRFDKRATTVTTMQLKPVWSDYLTGSGQQVVNCATSALASTRSAASKDLDGGTVLMASTSPRMRGATSNLRGMW